MIYAFAEFELDTGRAELRSKQGLVHVEPQVFDLLLLLVANFDRVVSRDEIIESVWNGRIVSEGAIDSRIRSARKAIGDSGTAQQFIKTIRGRGLRFVAEVTSQDQGTDVLKAADASPAPRDAGAPSEQLNPNRPSIAVLPFSLVGVAGPYAGVSDALATDLITELSRLRWLFVIARGSSFKFRGNSVHVGDVGRQLGVSYCLTGSTEVTGSKLTVSVELSDTRTGGVVWADRRESSMDLVHESRQQIVSNIVANLEVQIAEHEAANARMSSPNNLDAWSAYHIGVHHMYRFSKADNARAGEFFRQAISLEPGFARAHAGLSFVHFQNAFVQYSAETDKETELARRFAERAMELDPYDPSANMNMGRSLWLTDQLGDSQHWLDRAIQLNPNYAHGIYSQAWTTTVLGHGEEGQKNADLAMSLSPLDPLYYAMSATRSMSHAVRDEFQQAAIWGERGAQSPGAHIYIEMIALAAHGLNGDDAKAKYWLAKILERNPSVTHHDFFVAFPFDQSGAGKIYTEVFARYGL